MDKKMLFARLCKFFRDETETMEDETFSNWIHNLGFTSEELKYLHVNPKYLQGIGFEEPTPEESTGRLREICRCPECGAPVFYQGDWGFDEEEKVPLCLNCGAYLSTLPEGY